jgi:hypothetical protein
VAPKDQGQEKHMMHSLLGNGFSMWPTMATGTLNATVPGLTALAMYWFFTSLCPNPLTDSGPLADAMLSRRGTNRW